MRLDDERSSVFFNKIIVNSIEASSGIFVGINSSYGWRSFRKSNYGLGRCSNCTIQQTFSVVYDNDLIDFPVDDQAVHLHLQKSPAEQQIQFRSIDVNAMNTNSTVAVGESNQAGWNSLGKNNMGDGRHNGINVMRGNANLVVDNDMIDAPMQEIKRF